MGVAVIFLTLAIRIVLLPFSIRAAQSEYRMDKVRPEIEKIRHRYRHDIEMQRRATKEILHENKIGIFSNLLSLGFQILVFLVLYSIFSSGLQLIGKNVLYPFNLDPGVITPYFLNRFSMISPDAKISVFAALVVFLSQLLKARRRRMDESTSIDKALLVGLPIGTYLATIVLPSAKALFIAASVVFSLWLRAIRWLVFRYIVKDDEELKENVEKIWTN